MRKTVQKVLSLLLCVVMMVGVLPMAASAKTITQYSRGNIIEFGWYPQSEVKDSTITAQLNAKAPDWDNWASYGYYSGTGTRDDGQMTAKDYMRYVDIYLDGNKYRGVMFTAYRPSCTGYTSSTDESYQDDNGYSPDTVYWFKYDPLQWRVLDPATGLVLCETIIDSQAYNNYVTLSGDYRYGDAGKTRYANNYAKSSIRKWLNEDFYNTAFSAAQQNTIETTALENKAYSTSYSRYDSASTNDKIFFLTYSDVLNTGYGFSSSWSTYDINRRASGSDYAKCQGLSVTTSTSSDYLDKQGNKCSDWWLRSAGSGSGGACYVASVGYRSNYYNADDTSMGVRPAFKLNLTSEIVQSDIAAETRTISFDTDGGSAVAPITGWVGSAVTAPANPTKAGYTFTGWDKRIPTTMPAEDMTIKAQWTPKYTWSFNLNGGTADTPTSISVDYGSNAENLSSGIVTLPSSEYPHTPHDYGNSMTYNYSVSYPGASELILDFSSSCKFESNYDYLYLYDKSGSLIGTYTGTTLASKSITVTGDYVSIKVTTNNSGTYYGFSFSSIKAKVDCIPTPTRTGYTFTGWTPEIPETVPVGNKSFTAGWSVNQYTITFDSDGGNINESITLDYGASFTPPGNPVRAGYTFAGWSPAIPTTMPAQDMTIKAQWTPLKYTWSFSLNGGTADTPTSILVDCGSNVEDLPNGIVTLPSSEYPQTPHNYGNSMTYNYSVSYPGASELILNFSSSCKFESNCDYLYLYNKSGSLIGTYTGTTLASKSITVTGDYVSIKVTTDSSSTYYGFSFSSIKAKVNGIPTPTRTGYTFTGWTPEIPETVPVGNKSFTAGWSVNQYTITFDSNGGSSVATITQDYGTTITTPANPTKEHYTFTGWSPALPKTMPAENMQLSAQWKINSHTITFDTDGGSTVAPITKDYSASVTAPADPTKPGFVFQGWDKAIPTTMPDEDLTIKAIWKANQYTITFDTDGGSPVEAITQDCGSVIATPLNPTKAHYTFAGWSPALPTVMPPENRTVKAQWTLDTFTLTFDMNGGDGETTTLTAGYGTPITDGWVTGAAGTAEVLLPAASYPETPHSYSNNQTYDYSISYPGATKLTLNFSSSCYFGSGDYLYLYDKSGTQIARYTGYDLQGRTVTVTGDSVSIKVTTNSSGTYYGFSLNSVKAVRPGKPIPATSRTGYTFTGWTPAIPESVPAQDTTFVAGWSINRYTITFDTDGGSTIAPITQDYGTVVAAPENPTKEHHTFAGWSADVPTTMPAQNVTLKALWNLDTFTITFDTDGGSAIAPITQGYGTDVTRPVNPVKPGYSFQGWDQGIPSYMPDYDMTIKAIWLVNSYTITFNTNGGTAIPPVTENYGTDITTPADPTKEGYTFTGWDKTIPETMPAQDMTITAQWSINSYTLTFDLNGGTGIAEPIIAPYGAAIEDGYVANSMGDSTTITLPSSEYPQTPHNYGNSMTYNYSVSYPGAEKLILNFSSSCAFENNYDYLYLYNKSGSLIGSYTGTTLAGKSITVTGDYVSIKVTTDGSTTYYGFSFSSIKAVVRKMPIPTPTRTGYTFTGWTPEIPDSVPAQDMTFTAGWQINQYTVNVDIVSEKDSTVTGAGTYDYGSTVTLKAVPKDGEPFSGWYSGTRLVSKDTTYSFTITEDMSLTAWFGVRYQTGDLLELGSYPQSRVTNATLLAQLNEKAPSWDSWQSYGYYSGTGSSSDGQMTAKTYMRYVDVTLNGAKYRGVKFTSYRPGVTGYSATASNSNQDENGYSANGAIYWFKYSSLRWRVLDPEKGLLLCETIIDAQAYNNFLLYSGSYYYGDSAKTYYANNYVQSSIRQWLNSTFMDTAFTAAEKALLQSTTLNNDGYSSSYNATSTTDKVFLLSYGEAQNSSYGLGSGSARMTKGTDYAKVQNLFVSTSSSYRGNSDWLLRSAGNASNTVCAVDDEGGSVGYSYNSYYSGQGVRPALCVNLKAQAFQSAVPNVCIHTYGTGVKTEANCLEKGFTTYACTKCGYSYIDNITDYGPHSYTKTEVTKPTKYAQGYTTHICAICGNSYKDTYTNPPATFYLECGSAVPGQDVTVTIKVKDNPGLIGAKLTIQYDKSVLTLKSVACGSLFSSSYFTPGENLNANPYSMVFLDALSAINHTGNTTLATLTFHISSGATIGKNTAISLSYDQASTFDASLGKLLFNTTGGSVYVKDYPMGDVNADGKVNLKDVVTLTRYLSDSNSTTILRTKADVNRDGVVSLLDAAIIRRYLAGWKGVTLG